MRTKYDNIVNDVLKKYIGDIKCYEVTRQFLIIAYRTNSIPSKKGKLKVFDNTDSAPLWEAVRASMSAPTFFEPITIDKETFIDGGLLQNNPSQCVIDHWIKYGILVDEMNIVNLCTGSIQSGVKFPKRHGNIKTLKLLLNDVTDGNVSVTDYHCRQILGYRYKRIMPKYNKDYDLDEFGYMDQVETAWNYLTTQVKL
jgi:hypothetical protein